MASIREVSGLAEELLCSICLSIFQEPRMLSCGHNFCLSCLETCVASKGQQGGTCPQCRQPFDLRDATHNRVLANLADKARLLKLEEGAQSKEAGNWYFCDEHEEPLKLFCSQDEVLICVICRDLPQHQGHTFLPIKNAVKAYQNKLKASLESLEDDVKWATTNQSCQVETIEELESLSESLYSRIFFGFDDLHQILTEREQSLMETVKQMEEDNKTKMKGRLEYLKEYESAHTAIVSRIRDSLEETNGLAFLKEVKELMGRIQDCLEEGREDAENEASEQSQLGKEEEKKDSKDEEGKDDQAEDDGYEVNTDDAAYSEAEYSEAGEDGDIVHIDRVVSQLKESLEFESWKEILRSISIPEAEDAPDFSCFSSLPEENMLQPEHDSNSQATGAASTLEKELTHSSKVSTFVPEESIHDKRLHLPRGSCNTAPVMQTAPYYLPTNQPPPNFFPPPGGPQVLYHSVRGWRPPLRRMSYPNWGHGMFRGRGNLPQHSFGRRGRGCVINIQMPKVDVTTVVDQRSCSSPEKEASRSRDAQVPGQGWFNRQRPQSSGSHSDGKAPKKQPPKPTETHVQGGSGQSPGSAKKPPTHHQGGEAPSISNSPQSGQSSHRGHGSGGRRGRGSGGNRGRGRGRGRGHGCDSAKGVQKT